MVKINCSCASLKEEIFNGIINRLIEWEQIHTYIKLKEEVVFFFTLVIRKREKKYD